LFIFCTITSIRYQEITPFGRPPRTEATLSVNMSMNSLLLIRPQVYPESGCKYRMLFLLPQTGSEKNLLKTFPIS
ncbi:hypothetical protein, partial [Robiginitalea sp. SC105]|uniref:hypothetical protein n=1 Tax=Robiginitalea sp. SC105 TaxID=2762332 RepID=UPI001C8E321F